MHPAQVVALEATAEVRGRNVAKPVDFLKEYVLLLCRSDVSA